MADSITSLGSAVEDSRALRTVSTASPPTLVAASTAPIKNPANGNKKL